MEEPLVSIITPAFNASKYIRETIESVQSQIFQNWEMLVINDHSTDGTEKIVRSFADKDSRIKLLKTLKNSGPAIARQVGLDRAQGDYIAFLDSDDLWLPNKLKIQVENMKKNNLDFTYTQYRRISEKGESIGRLISVPSSVSYEKLLSHNVIACLTVVVSKRAIENIKMVNEGYDDFILWLSILKKGIVAYGISQDLARYRIVSNSVSRNRLRAVKWVWNIYRNVEKFSLLKASFYFSKYVWNVSIKHLRF